MRAKLEITLLPGSRAVGAAHREAGAQRDHLCGPYWVSTLLRAAGFAVGQEEAAVAAGTRVPASPDPDAVPPGEPARPASDARIASVDDAASAGTSATGMIDAVRTLSGGACALVPVRGRRGEPLGAEALERLLETVADHPSWDGSVLANLRTGHLWGTGLSPVDAIAYLDGAEVGPPPPEWDVGHFVEVAALVRGDARTMVLLRDSYPSFGWAGHHLQPLEVVASGIARGDGHEGGCLVFVRSAGAGEAERELRHAGFEVGIWDNGTPYQGGTQ